MNHVLTFGMDIHMRKKAVRRAVRNGGAMWLDMCTGTGETAVYLRKAAPDGTKLFAADFSLPMINEAKKKKELKELIKKMII